MSDNLKQKTLKGVSWSFVEQILTRGVNFVIGIILARLLSPTDYGLVGMMGIFIAISQLFVDGGLTSALIRTKDPSDKDFSTVYIINLTLSVVFYFLLFFSAPLVASFYSQPMLKPLMRAVAIILIISSVASVQGTLLTIHVDFKTKSQISILSAVISGAIGIICAYKGLGVWALVAQSIASATAVTIFTLAFVRWIPKLVFSVESFKRLFSYSSKLLAASCISTIYDNVYPLVIGKKFSAADVGVFTRAGQFPSIANETIVGALNRVAFPILSQVQDDNERLLHVYEKYIQLACFIIFPLLMGLCGCAESVVRLLLTEKWLACVPLMQIICFSKLLNGVTVINLNLLYVKGRSDLVLRLEFFKKSIAFLILFISMFFNVTVMCFGLVLYAVIAAYLNTIYTNRILGYSFWQQMKSILPYFLISLVVLAESMLCSHLFENDLISLLFALVICSLTYALISKWTKVYAYNEVIELIKSKLNR